MWNSAAKNPPERGGNYLVVTKNGNILVLNYNTKHQLWNVCDTYTDSAIDVDWWIEIPERPKKPTVNFDFSSEADFVNKALKEEDK